MEHRVRGEGVALVVPLVLLAGAVGALVAAADTARAASQPPRRIRPARAHAVAALVVPAAPSADAGAPEALSADASVAHDAASPSDAPECPPALDLRFADASSESFARPEEPWLAFTQWRLAHPNASVVVVATTGARGSSDAVLHLSRRRLDAIGDWLVSIGVDRADLELRAAPTSQGARPEEARVVRVRFRGDARCDTVYQEGGTP